MLTRKQRREMLVRANLEHVDQLYHIGCQLSVLKRVYQAYELIIERVLKKQEPTLASLKNSRIVSGMDSLASSVPVGSPGLPVPEVDSMLGVSLSSAARARFERLKDRIMLYALSEIQECIDQKESLVMMVRVFILVGSLFSQSFPLTLAPEFQPHRHQGVFQCRAPNTHYASSRQSYDCFHAGDPHDRILFYPVRKYRVHGEELLVGFRCNSGS